MATTTSATPTTAWDCKWSRPGYWLSGAADKAWPESLWVCVRTGRRLNVVESDCESCPDWEQHPKAKN